MRGTVVLAACCCVLGGISAPAAQALAGRENCSVRSSTYMGWEARELTTALLKLTVVPQLGGRLMQVEFNGHPYLFVNPKYRGRYVPPSEARGEWINYGGDKIWPMPEGDGDEHHWVLASTAIDDLPYEFKVLAEGERCSVELRGKPDPITGLMYTRTIGVSAGSPEIHFHAVMRNATAHAIAWSVQSVTQYDLADEQRAGDYNRDFWAYAPVNPDSSYPGGFHVRSGLADDPSIAVRDGVFRLHWLPFSNEVWLDSASGWLAVVDKTTQYGMVERFTAQEQRLYPDRASVIFYKNGASVHFDKEGRGSVAPISSTETPAYMEAEVNSPVVSLEPGEEFGFDTTWNPIRIGEVPRAVRDAGVVTQPARLLRSAGGGDYGLTAKLSVFYAGDLKVVFFDGRGVAVGEQMLERVTPAKEVALQRSFVLPAGLASIRLTLTGEHGEDYGVLDSADVPDERRP